MLSQFSKVTNITHLVSSDVLFLGIAFIIFFVYSVYAGRNRTVSLVFAYYPAVLLYKNFPFASKLIIAQGAKMIALNKVGVFLIFFIPIYIIISRFIVIEGLHLSKPNFMQKMHLLRNVGLSLVCLSVLVLFSYTVIDLTVFHQFSPMIASLFSTPMRIFYINLVPIILLAVV
jgi:hypothetical protein